MSKTIGRILALGIASGCCGAVLAADEGELSMLTVIVEGFEWPMWFILIGSIAAISLIVEHFITIRRSTICPKDEFQKARQMIEGRAFRECLDVMQKSRTFFARTMTASLQHARHGFDAMHEAAVEKSGELSGKMFRKVEYLNIIGNLGPLMGLVGTVLGMIVAFQAMGSGGGEAGAGELAKGISLALANTLLGLSLAVVGIGSFGICRNRIDSYTVEATVESLDLLEYFRPAAAPGRSSESKKASRTEPPKSAARPAPQPAKTS